MAYMLERKEEYIVKTEMLKNTTHQTHRWKQVALSHTLDALKPYCGKGMRIIDWNTLEVVWEGK